MTTFPKPSQKTITQMIDVMQWTLSGDDAEAAEETRRQCRLAGPYSAGYLIGRRARRCSDIGRATRSRCDHALGRGRDHKIQD